MSFTEANMQTFSDRCEALVLSLQNIRQEAAKLQAIYENEALSGAAPEWGDSKGATAQEHVDIILLAQDLKKFFGNEAVGAVDREQYLTPFLQG